MFCGHPAAIGQQERAARQEIDLKLCVMLFPQRFADCADVAPAVQMRERTCIPLPAAAFSIRLRRILL
jgi:hypothetical protein